MPNETPGAVCSHQRLYQLLKFVACACFLVVIIAIVSVLIHSTPDTRNDDDSRVSLINTIKSQESPAVAADENDTYYNNNTTGGSSDGQGNIGCPPLRLDTSQRRDCWPWSGANQSACEARGCVWCPVISSGSGIPWCFMNDEICPSEIPESSRQDCYPESGSTRNLCLQRGCVWCPTKTSGIPWCFKDTSVSMGGQVCPSDITNNNRIDCFPTDGATNETCVARGCYWCSSAVQDTPWCFVPPSHGYRMVGSPTVTAKGFQVILNRVRTPSWYGGDIDRVTLDAEFQADHRLRVKIYDPNNARYEVPGMNIPSPPTKAANPLYDIAFSNSPSFNFKVTRKSNGAVIFDTSLGGFKFSDQFLQISTKLPSSNVYGFAETMHESFKHNMNWKSYGMWGRDEPVGPTNLYGTHPFYTVLDEVNMSGTLILNSNAQEVTMTPAPGLVYRTAGGILDLYFFFGPQPEAVIAQYTEAIGRPVMPPYWALGFQLSRYGYNSLDNMKAAIKRLRDNNIPQDVQHGDIDYFDKEKDFTYDPVNFAGLPDFVRQLKTEGTRFITILDPFISSSQTPGAYPPFDRGQTLGAWVTQADGSTPAESICWPGVSYYADYSKASGQTWWSEQCVNYHNTIEFDGLWVDMNEPASFKDGSTTGCFSNNVNYPQYKPRTISGLLTEKTLCPDYLTAAGSLFNTHNLYGKYMAKATQPIVRLATGGKRSIVITRSTFPGSGKYAGRWLGDNHSNWVHMAHSIIGSLEFNLFGIPYVGPDTCGFFGNTTEELCGRWMELGSFFPFSRNHNGLGWTDQDPGVWPSVANISRETLRIRYTILPYLYTLFHEVHAVGGTVVRPLLHEFVTDAATYGIDKQFLLGPAFMITPVLEQGKTSVTGYFPDALWYRYRDGVLENFRGQQGNLSAPFDFIPLHVRGGYILPTQEPANSTMFSRKNPMGLIAALDDNGEAAGSLFWDEGDTPDTYENGQYFLGKYSVKQRVLTGTVQANLYAPVSALFFNKVAVWGVATAPTSLTVNGTVWPNYTYTAATKVLSITQLNIVVNTNFLITW